MGFYEDDRIRSKNLIHNKAYELYEELRAKGLANGDIEAHCTDLMKSEVDSIRNEIFLSVLKIVRSSPNEPVMQFVLFR
jgi:hypothetical protein